MVHDRDRDMVHGVDPDRARGVDGVHREIDHPSGDTGSGQVGRGECARGEYQSGQDERDPAFWGRSARAGEENQAAGSNACESFHGAIHSGWFFQSSGRPIRNNASGTGGIVSIWDSMDARQSAVMARWRGQRDKRCERMRRVENNRFPAGREGGIQSKERGSLGLIDQSRSQIRAWCVVRLKT